MEVDRALRGALLEIVFVGATFLAMTSVAAGQTSGVILLSKEPHHHRMLHNELVNLYRVEVQPKDSVLLHRHDFDAISIMLGDAQVIVRAPGKPEVRQNLTEGQVRLQPRGYVHSTLIDGDNTYHNVTVELLRKQQDGHNLCAEVMAGQPLHCPSSGPASSGRKDQPQFATDQTTVTLVSVQPHKEIKLSNPDGPELMVALDEATLEFGRTVKQHLHPGDFAFVKKGSVARTLKNDTDKELRYVSFALKP
jgi:quercetin dioxygenase-like cupin family protein